MWLDGLIAGLAAATLAAAVVLAPISTARGADVGSVTVGWPTRSAISCC